MYRFVSVLVAATAALSATASPLQPRSIYAVKESHKPPAQWSNIGEPHPLHPLSLNIGLEPNDFDSLEQHLHQVSDPSHARYGQHLSQQQVHQLLRPSSETADLVRDWLANNGIDPSLCQTNTAQDWITVTLPIAKIEQLLDAKYSIYQHEDGTKLVRTTSWSLPQSLHDHITTIQPTTAFLRANPKGNSVFDVPLDLDLIQATEASNATSIKGACNFGGMTPKCLRTLYNTIDYKPQASHNNSIAFTNFLGQVSNRTDAKTFLQNFRPDAVDSAFAITQISINGGPVDITGDVGSGSEGNLDLETVLGLVYPTPVVLYTTGGSPPWIEDNGTVTNTNEPYLTWLLFLRDQEISTVPKVISTSYGDHEQTVPLSYARTVCNQFAALGAQGISLFFSSGDFGVGQNNTCTANDGTNHPTFVPSFPASCPYVTTVGGTRNYPEVVAYDASNSFVSGSGFSNYFSRPQWQDTVVQQYLDTIVGSESKGLFNASGRAYPDLAAQAYRYIVWINGTVHTLDGTSASAPTVASIFSLVNDALIAKGKAPMGWLNPWLYKTGHQAFTDVVNGSSTGCDGPGFAASKGWDVASGFGTPDFELILQVLGVGGP